MATTTYKTVLIKRKVIHSEGRPLPPLTDKACVWLLRSLGFFQVLSPAQVLPLHSAELSQLCCVYSMSLLSANCGKSLQLCYTSTRSLHAKPNHQRGRKAEKRQRRVKDRQHEKTRERTKRKRLWLFPLCIYTSFYSAMSLLHCCVAQEISAD